MKNIAVIDFSWEMHRNRESLKMLTVTRTLPSGVQQTVPTGHVYGTWQDIQNLAQKFDLVFLAVDSPCSRRKQLLAAYKSDRHTPTGDPLLDYNIYNDLVPLLKLCTSLPNVFYVKQNEYEADDIIASFMKDSNTNTNWSYSIFMRDKDILQTKGIYSWHDKLTGRPLNRGEYIAKVAKIDSSFDWLPVLIKTVTGDTSDKIPNAIPRFPKDKLNEACYLISAEDYSFESILRALKQVRGSMSSTWQERLKCLDDETSIVYKQLSLNYQMVYPMHMSIKEMKFKQLGAQPDEVNQILDSYQIRH